MAVMWEKAEYPFGKAEKIVTIAFSGAEMISVSGYF
jgi:hypothetical protein